MPDFTGGTDWWRDIPNGVVEQDARQTTADDWAAQQRAQLAAQWADSQRAELASMHPTLGGGDQNVPAPMGYQSLAAQTRNPMGGWSDTAQAPSSGAADADVPVPYSAQSLQAQARQNGPMADSWSGVVRPDTAIQYRPALDQGAGVPPVPPLPDSQAGSTPLAPDSPAASPAPRGPLNDISQLGQAGLSYDDALAACGPAAAVRLASLYGNNIPLSAALSAAKQVGWTNAGGMNGIGNEKRLLDQLGIPATVDTSPAMAKIISDAQSGNPVTLSTPNHYFTLSGYNPDTGQFHVGQSGLVFRGGSADMTWDQIRRLGGGVNGALFVDAPTSATPGTAALDAGKSDPYKGNLDQQAVNPQAPTAPAPLDFGNLAQQAQQAVGGAVQQGVQAVGDTASAVGQGLGDAAGALGQAAGAAGNAAATAVQQAPRAFGDILNEARQATGYVPDQPVNTPGFGYDPSSMRAPAAPPPGVPLTTDEHAPAPGPGAFDQGGFVDNLNQIRKQVAPSVLDPEFAQRNDVSDPENAAGLVLSLAGEPYQKALALPSVKATATMLKEVPPKPVGDGAINWIVRQMTNRNVSADQFQERALNSAGLSTSNPPEALDLSARIRQLATDGAVKVAEDNVLKPAINSIGGGAAGQELLSNVLVHQNNVDVAAVTGNTYRKFPGGGSLIQSQTALNDIKQSLGPAGWAKVQDAANQVYGLVHDLRQQMLDSGLISQSDFQRWNGQQPHFIPTRILDYLDENGGPPVGSKVSIGDSGVRHYTPGGTDKAQEDPLASVLNMVAQVNRNARKNDAVGALLGLDQLGGKPQLTPTTAPVTADGRVVQYIRNGTVERYLAPAELANVIDGPAIQQFPKWVQGWTGFNRAVNTIASPAFALVRNPTLDIPEYLLRSTARAGGNPLAIPHIMVELGKGYADAFQGLLQGKLVGPGTQQYLGGGGTGSTLVSTFANRADIVKGLAGGTEIKSVGDVQRILKSVLGAVPAMAERTELGPRIAAMRLAEQQGATPLRAVLAGRTVTMDFNEGGTFAKGLNQVIPFFNAGVQGSVIPVRMFKENPAGALAASMAMVGLPSVAAEAWNNSDPQRARDYQDVPQYLKQGGVVFMLPGEAQLDAQGNRKPGFFWVNMRGMAPLASIAREAAQTGLQAAKGVLPQNNLPVLGGVAQAPNNVTPEDWATLLSDLAAGASPIRANTIGDVGNALTGPGLVPGISALTQLQTNKDQFRGSDIVSKFHDQQAPASAQALAAGLSYIAQRLYPKADIHPSQVDFAVKQLLGGVGSTLEGAGDPLAKAAGFQSASPNSTPILGGMAKAAGFRSDTGEALRTAANQRTPDDITAIYRSAGLPPDYQQAPVDSTITVGRLKVPLTQDEQTQVQRLTSQNVADEVRAMAKDPSWAKASPESKQAAIKRTETRQHAQAERQVLGGIPDAEIRRRIP